MYNSMIARVFKGARSGQPGAGGMPHTGKVMGNSAGSANKNVKAAVSAINSPDGLAWEANHGKGTVKVVGDEIHLTDTHSSMSNAERAAGESQKNWSPGGAYYKWLSEEHGITVSHAGSEAKDAAKPKAFAQYESVHKIKIHAAKAEYASLFKGAPLGNDNAAGPHAPFTHSGTPLKTVAEFKTTASKDSIPRTATQERAHQKDLDSDNWHTKTMAQFKDKTNYSLNFIRRDAAEAAKAQPEGKKAGQYQDEVHYASMELKARSDYFSKVKKSENGPTLPLTTLVSDDPTAIERVDFGYASLFKGARRGPPGAGVYIGPDHR